MNKMLSPIILRTCKNCHETFPIEKFPKAKEGKGGHRPICKPCARADQSRYEEKLKSRTEFPQIMEKTCTKCRKSYSITSFSRDTRTKSGYHSNCKSCVSKWIKKTTNKAKVNSKRREKYHSKEGKDNFLNTYYRSRYGITFSEYNEILEKQGGVCGICGKKPKNKLHSLDHCHQTGKIRGILCSNCNTGLGLLGDTVECLAKANNYLKNFL